MDFRVLHPWNLSLQEAVLLQNRLRPLLQFQPLRKPVEIIAGADISFNQGSATVYAGFVSFDVKNLRVLETAEAVSQVSFPYVPGLLSFREIPPLLEAWRKIKIAPDVVILDGQGIAHPRRMGIAAHFGLWIDRPTLGCAKSILVGKYSHLGDRVGSCAALVDRGEQVGIALRTKAKCLPVFVSPGHKITLEDSLHIALTLNRGYRIPEPTRQAHIFVNQLRRKAA